MTVGQSETSAFDRFRESLDNLAASGRRLDGLPCPVCGHPSRNCTGKVTSACYPYAKKEAVDA